VRQQDQVSLFLLSESIYDFFKIEDPKMDCFEIDPYRKRRFVAERDVADSPHPKPRPKKEAPSEAVGEHRHSPDEASAHEVPS
jgi:hypothetical protein